MFYIIRGEVYRSKGTTENPIEIYEEFREVEPIIAREKAFSYYQNYIDVFLDSKEKKYISHEQAEKDLQDFFNSFQEKYSVFGKIDADFGICIQISFVFDDTVVYTLKSGIKIYKGEEVIHGMHKNSEDLKEIYFKNLKFENLLYLKNGYETNGLAKGYDVSGLFEDKELEYILKTPIDFNKVLNDRL
jgi:hypothetical protein